MTRLASLVVGLAMLAGSAAPAAAAQPGGPWSRLFKPSVQQGPRTPTPRVPTPPFSSAGRTAEPSAQRTCSVTRAVPVDPRFDRPMKHQAPGRPSPSARVVIAPPPCVAR